MPCVGIYSLSHVFSINLDRLDGLCPISHDSKGIKKRIIKFLASLGCTMAVEVQLIPVSNASKSLIQSFASLSGWLSLCQINNVQKFTGPQNQTAKDSAESKSDSTFSILVPSPHPNILSYILRYAFVSAWVI